MVKVTISFGVNVNFLPFFQRIFETACFIGLATIWMSRPTRIEDFKRLKHWYFRHFWWIFVGGNVLVP